MWHRKVYGPVLHWTEGTEIFPNWRSFDAASNRANHQIKAFKNLGLPSFNFVAFPSLSLH